MCRACEAGQKPLAAVWWRVSTDPQKDISPDTQKNEALPWLRLKGTGFRPSISSVPTGTLSPCGAAQQCGS